MRMHYVSVVVEGKLDDWTGCNPEKRPEDVAIAILRAEYYRSLGKTAYAVEVKELKADDYQ